MGGEFDKSQGYFISPTVVVTTDPKFRTMSEEIFGPVLTIYVYEADAFAIANDTPYGLAAYLSTGDDERAKRVAGKLRAGSVHINGAGINYGTPFGGYKQSGNGREWGEY